MGTNMFARKYNIYIPKRPSTVSTLPTSKYKKKEYEFYIV